MKNLAIFFSALMAAPLFALATIPLKSGTPEEIVSAIDDVVAKNIKDKSTLSTLVEALGSDETDVHVRERAAWALGQLKAGSAEKSLLQAARHKSLLIRAAALNALIHLRSQSALPIFIEVAQTDPILSLRQRSTIALGLLKNDKAIEALVKLSDDPREEIRGAAALSMGGLHSAKNNFSEILQEMVKDASPYVQERAQSALIMTQGKNDLVTPHLASDDSDIRLFAVLYFHFKGKQPDLKALSAAQNSEADDEVRAELDETIKAIKKRVAQANAKKSKKPPNPHPAHDAKKSR